MIFKTNPFIALHSNFDPETGDLSESGWPKKEVLLIRITDNIDRAKNTQVQVFCDENKTTIFEGRSISLEVEGNLLEDIGNGIEFNELALQVDDINNLIKSSKVFFAKTLGDFSEDESALSDWFDYDKRKSVLMDKAFNKMISDGLYNHLISIIHTPFTKGLFQRGELNSDSPDMFTDIYKRSLKIQ